jgi:acyl carrier protein
VFDDGATADRLAPVLLELRPRAEPTDPDGRFVRQWAAHHVGRVVVDAYLLAAARSAADADAVAWADERFERSVADARRGVPDAGRYSSDALAGRIAAFAHDIGDVEQTLPGEETDRDPLLAREPTEAPRTPPRVAPPPRRWVRPARDPAPEYGRLVRELLPRRGVPVTDATTFAELGMESLERAELVAEIGKRTGLRFGPDLVYEMGTVGELIAYLERHRPE